MEGEGSIAPAPEEGVTLEEVALAFQKAMARAAQATARSVADTPAMRYGTRQIYTVQQLEVELRVGAEVRRLERDGRATEQVRLTFDPERLSAGGRAARLRFSVVGAPLPEALREAGLFLRVERAEGRPEGAPARAGETIEARAVVCDAAGAPVPAALVVLEAMLLAPPEGAGLGRAWVEPAPGRRWLPPRWTDAKGEAQFRFRMPPSESALLRLRGRALLPGDPPAALSERKPVFLALEAGAAAGEGAGWETEFLAPEAAERLPPALRGEPADE